MVTLKSPGGVFAVLVFYICKKIIVLFIFHCILSLIGDFFMLPCVWPITFLLLENLVSFVLLYACFLVALWCFELHLVSMLYCSYRIVFMCWTCIHPYAIVLY